jgi:hypothetical protein
LGATSCGQIAYRFARFRGGRLRITVVGAVSAGRRGSGRPGRPALAQLRDAQLHWAGPGLPVALAVAGVEILREDARRSPLRADRAVWRASSLGLDLESKTGTLVLDPPLTIAEAEMDRALGIIAAAIAQRRRLPAGRTVTAGRRAVRPAR